MGIIDKIKGGDGRGEKGDKDVPPKKTGKSLLSLHRRLLSTPKEIPTSSLDKTVISDMDTFIKISGGALHTCLSQGVNVDSEYYKRVVAAREHLQGVLDKGSIDCTKSEFLSKLSGYSSSLKDLVDSNFHVSNVLRNKQNDKKNNTENDAHESIDDDNVTVNEGENYLHSRFLFSKEEVTCQIVKEKVITQNYHDLFNKKGVQRPAICDLADEILEGGQEDASLDKATYLAHLQTINEQLREAATSMAQEVAKKNAESKAQGAVNKDINQKDLNPFQIALRDVIAQAKTCHDWFEGTWEEKYSKWFDFNESWLQNSMETFGTRVEDVAGSFAELLSNKSMCDVFSQITNHQSANEIAYSYSPDKVISTWEEFTRTNARLDYIHGQLRDGFPVEFTPRIINGLQEKVISGEQNNCLIHSWLEVSTNWNETKITEEAKLIREVLVERINVRLGQLKEQIEAATEHEENVLSSENLLWLVDEQEILSNRVTHIKKGGTLEQGSHEGRMLIDYLSERGLIDRDRGLLLYRFQNRRVNCVESEVMPRKPDATRPPYTFSLKQNVHFNAMVPNEKGAGKPEPFKGNIHDINEMAKIYKIYLEKYKSDLKEVLKQKKEDGSFYRDSLETIETLSKSGSLESFQNNETFMNECQRIIEKFAAVDAAMPWASRVSAREKML